MSRAKKKRVQRMKRRIVVRRARAVVASLTTPFAVQMFNVAVYEHVQALVEGRAPPPFVATGVVAALFGALERSGMRRIRCSSCGNEWMTRGTAETCPPCQEKVTN